MAPTGLSAPDGLSTRWRTGKTDMGTGIRFHPGHCSELPSAQLLRSSKPPPDNPDSLLAERLHRDGNSEDSRRHPHTTLAAIRRHGSHIILAGRRILGRPEHIAQHASCYPPLHLASLSARNPHVPTARTSRSLCSSSCCP